MKCEHMHKDVPENSVCEDCYNKKPQTQSPRNSDTLRGIFDVNDVLNEFKNSEIYHKDVQAVAEVTSQRIKAEVVRVINEEIKKEDDCMLNDEHDEQVIEHQNQIEMANKIKKRLGI